MRAMTFRPKQSLGQNFLVDENIARKIVRLHAPTPDDTIVEIGPGFGALTRHIIPVVKKVIAVEIDRGLVRRLAQDHSGCNNLEIIQGDFLRYDLAGCCALHGPLRVVGNIPYHITSPVIFKVFALRDRIQDMLLMIQREVAERIVAKPATKQYGILSVFSQLYSQPKILFNISKNVFRPKPEIESAIVRWDFSLAKHVTVKDEKLLDLIIHASFQQRRKMLRKSLQQVPEFVAKMDSLQCRLERRPEELTGEDFVELTNLISE